MKRPAKRGQSAPEIRSVVIAANPEKKQTLLELPRLRAWLKRRSIAVLPISQISKSDGVITLGGDGTILSVAARAARAGVPVIGINVGWLGFMTATDFKKMYAGIERWLAGRFTVSARMMLEVEVPRIAEPFLALNDVVIRIGNTSRVMTIAASIDKEFLARFRGDGAIVASPTGSTAYSLSAQGPVVHPDVESLVLTPICPHSFTQRPVVFPAHHALELRVEDSRKSSDVQLCLDGQRVFWLRRGDIVRVRSASVKLKLLQDPQMPYFRILREKLSWGGN